MSHVSSIRRPMEETGKLAKLQPLPGNAPGQAILVVDDSRSVRDLLCSFISRIGGFTIESAGSLAEVRELLANDPGRFFCAALDLNLPDAPNGEVVDLVRSCDIPVVVLTASVSPSIRESILARNVVDYVSKSSLGEVEQVAYIIGRLRENRAKKILVVDDSPSFRLYVASLLEKYCYQTLVAANGREALDVLEQHADVTLVITDVHMPVMGGIELIAAIRTKYRREDLAIIGLSNASVRGLSATLLKTGANDFLGKPFEVEEFYCRVTQNTNMVGYVRQIRDLATRDFLTGVYNRRHLFEVGGTLHANAVRGNVTIATAVIDADHFKQINDTFGHQTGDDALRAIASALEASVRKTDVVARYGGEEFVVVAVVKQPDDATILFERLRANVAAIALESGGQPVPLRVSIGFTTSPGATLAAMIDCADAGVYEAKRAGRDRVVRT